MPRKSIPRTGAARNVQLKEHDPYRRLRKAKDALVCDDCGVVQHEGKWYWGAPPVGDVNAGLCPACQRIRDRYPAGTIRLHGLPGPLRDEVVNMIRNVAEHERQEHPLERLMDLEDQSDALVVTTTGMHLARAIAGALRSRFHGGVTVRYPAGDSLVQVEWTG
jgi:hypothetical protein